MAETEGITTGELSRAVALIRSDIGTLVAAIAARPDKEDLTKAEQALEARILATREIHELRAKIQDRAIKDLEDWQTWALRLGGPALVAAVAGVLYNAARIQ